MPVTLVCRRCGSEVSAKDVFCQECGLTQNHEKTPKPAVGKGMSDFDWPALEDPMSDSNTGDFRVNSLQNQTYDFSNYQLDLSETDSTEYEATAEAETVLNESCCQGSLANEVEPNSTTDCCETDSSAASTVATMASITDSGTEETAAKLHSPLFGKDKPIENDLGLRGGIGMVLIDNAVVIALVCFGLIFSCVGYKMYKDNETKKATVNKVAVDSSIIESVKADATRNDYQAVFDKLNGLRSQGKMEQFNQEQPLFNEAAFRLGEKAIEDGDINKATELLKQVAPDSQHYARAKELILQSTSRSATTAPAISAKLGSDNSTDATQANATAQRSTDAAPAVVAAPKPVVREISDKQVLSFPVIPEIEKMTADNNAASGSTAATAADGQASTGIDPNKATPAASHKFSESDISQYNRMLAEFLAKKEASGEDASTEAPSFREWLKTGKPRF